MERPIDDVLEQQLRNALARLYKEPSGLTIEELGHCLGVDALVAGNIVGQLIARHVVTPEEKQRYKAAFAEPPHPPSYFEPQNLRERRRHAEPVWRTDPRDVFVRDRERILFSSAFRRLSRITQVFPAASTTPAHNRITHSIKAGHIARSIAERLDRTDVDVNVVEAAALAHDIGHPPFGHAGEQALDKCMQAWGGFEGNAQTFRVLTKLSRIRPEFSGMNLTRATLNAVIKYPWFRGLPDTGIKHQKWNAYSTEAVDFYFARNSPGEDTSAEAKIMELSDDIAYGVHDLEDGVRANRIPLDQLITQSGSDYEAFSKELEPVFGDELKTALGILRLGGESLRKPFVDETEQRGDLRRLTTLLHQRYLLAVGPDLCMRDDLKKELRVLKAIMRPFVFEKLKKSQEPQRAMIESLFAHFLDRGRKDRGGFDLQIQESLSQDERAGDECTGDCKEAHLARAAADQIATMTEDEIVRRHAELPPNARSFVITRNARSSDASS